MTPLKSDSSATHRQTASGLEQFAHAGLLSPVLVIGANGSVGRLFVEQLLRSGLRVWGLDRSDAPPLGEAHLIGDVTSMTPEMLRLIGSAETVMVCLPEEVTLAACDDIRQCMRQGALWVDTLSVKSTICSRLEKEGKEGLEALSINPMFAPSCGICGQNIAAVQVNSGPKASRFLALLQWLGAVVTVLSAAEHDRMTQSIQVITHAAILAFGTALKSLGCDVKQAWRLSTPVHRILLLLLTRVVSANPQPYWDIQSTHPEGSRSRALLAQSISALEQMVLEKKSSNFEHSIFDLRQMLSPCASELQALSARLLECETVTMEKAAHQEPVSTARPHSS